MNYYLLNSDLEIVDGIEVFQSMIWTEKYHEIGDFELYIPASMQSLKLYTEAAKKHYYIVRAADTQDLKKIPAMMVESVELDDTYSNGDGLIIKGHQIKNLLYSRVIASTKEIVGNIQDELFRLVDDNAISTEYERVIPKLTLGDKLTNLGETFTNYPTEGEYLSTIISRACADNKMGWDIHINFVDKRLVFSLQKGVDRSHSQEGPSEKHNPYVVFSVPYNNLVKTTYQLDTYNYRNVAIVTSDYNVLDDKDQITVKQYKSTAKPYKLDKNPTGLERQEIYIKGNSPSPADGVTNILALSKTLETTARTKLEEYKSKTKINGEIAHNIGHEYGRDYFMGDLVTIQNEYGHSYDGRVTSVTINLSVQKNSTVPSFTIENYTGKEQEDEEKITENERRLTEDGNYRVASNGGNRQLVLGYIFRDRVDESGNTREDASFSTRSVTKCDNFDDEKYGIDVRR